MTLATLLFFCRRPTILAVMEFVNAINIKDDSFDSFSDSSSTEESKHESSTDMADEQVSVTGDDLVVKGLLGRGKSRTIFSLTLNLASAQILLMKENEDKLATLSQDNLLTDIKVNFSLTSVLNDQLLMP